MSLAHTWTWSAISTATKEGIHDVAKTTATTESPTKTLTTHVILLTLLWVTQNIVGSSYLFKFILNFRIWIYIGVKFARNLAISLLNLILRCTTIKT